MSKNFVINIKVNNDVNIYGEIWYKCIFRWLVL